MKSRQIEALPGTDIRPAEQLANELNDAVARAAPRPSGARQDQAGPSRAGVGWGRWGRRRRSSWSRRRPTASPAARPIPWSAGRPCRARLRPVAEGPGDGPGRLDENPRSTPPTDPRRASARPSRRSASGRSWRRTRRGGSASWGPNRRG